MTRAKKQKNAITYPKGFYASGIRCGIKRSKSKKDLALVYSEVPAVAAATFTKNRLKAWPVQYSEKAMKAKKHRAIIANSGNANCFTGSHGKETTAATVSFATKALSIAKKELLIASTGVIGVPIENETILCSIPELCSKLSRSGGHNAAEGILTTDTVTKEVTAQFKLGAKTIKIGAIAKGAGMVKPNMATMLVFLTTDLAISKRLLQKAISSATQATFNCISIDNDESTNDSVFALANGLAGNKTVTKEDAGFKKFQAAVRSIFSLLAKLMMQDGEGVSRICELQIKGAKTEAQAKAIGVAIGDSMLFKTALAGGDPNWGRIVAVLGAKRDVSVKLNQIDIQFGSVSIIKNGKIASYSKKAAEREFSKKEVKVSVNLKSGQKGCSFWTTDLTKEYVRINSEYTT